MFKKQQFGIDLGSDLIKIYNARKNTLLKEKNMIAVMDPDIYLAVGNDAYEIYEKNPKNLHSPMFFCIQVNLVPLRGWPDGPIAQGSLRPHAPIW